MPEKKIMNDDKLILYALYFDIGQYGSRRHIDIEGRPRITSLIPKEDLEKAKKERGIYYYNNNCFYSYNKTLLKEKANSIKNSWIEDAKRELKAREDQVIKYKLNRKKDNIK